MNRLNHAHIHPSWPAPSSVFAYSTTRIGGKSKAPPYKSFNLAEHVGDNPTTVQHNRQHLAAQLNLPTEPIWLAQIHSDIAVNVDNTSENLTADAAYTNQQGIVCVVMTADCLPILVCNREGTEVAAIHAGWRGLTAGVIQNTLKHFACPASQLLIWLGPAIGPEAFVVGNEVREQFINQNVDAIAAFKPSVHGRWLADIYHLAKLTLNACGVTAVYGEPQCTYSNPELFFSYRRDGITGRMASLIWFE